MSFRRSGFTLLELVVTVAVMAVAMAIAFPSFQNTLRSNRVSTSINDLVSIIALARSEGMRSTQGGGVCASANGSQCGTDWSAGWLAWADANGNGVFDAGETVLRFSNAGGGLLVTGPGTPIAFEMRGLRRGAATQTIAMQPADCGGQALRRILTITPTGQVRTQTRACL